MMPLEINTQAQGEVKVKGDLTFACINKKTVSLIDFKGSRYHNVVTVDLSDVNMSDSAGLALMIEWIKLSRIHSVKLVFKYIPQQLMTLAKLSGFDSNEYFVRTLQD